MLRFGKVKKIYLGKAKHLKSLSDLLDKERVSKKENIVSIVSFEIPPYLIPLSDGSFMVDIRKYYNSRKRQYQKKKK